jgi:AcrR family transcriptional regulator
MPKVVDHDERRRRIADALLRIAAQQGLESVSLRHVAAEAGVSSGMVQHYFATKDEMMTFALDVVRESVEARMEIAAGELGDSPSPAALVRAILVQLLPFDRRRRDEARVTIAFLAYAAVNPTIAARLREDNAQLIALVADLIAAAQSAGDAPRDLDANSSATAIVALMEGLGLHALNGDYSPETALAVFDDYAEKVFGPQRGRSARKRRP